MAATMTSLTCDCSSKQCVSLWLQQDTCSHLRSQSVHKSCHKTPWGLLCCVRHTDVSRDQPKTQLSGESSSPNTQDVLFYKTRHQLQILEPQQTRVTVRSSLYIHEHSSLTPFSLTSRLLNAWSAQVLVKQDVGLSQQQSGNPAKPSVTIFDTLPEYYSRQQDA